MKLSVIKALAAILLLAVAVAAISAFSGGVFKRAVTKLILTENVQTVKPYDKTKTVIIDPGHGGEDPGAVGVNGLLEKDVNLRLSLVLKELLILQGYNVVMTRDTDVLLYDENASGSKKGQDLKNRLDFEKKYPDAVFVSIHMNKFSMESCKGLQVYYSANTEESKALAEAVKENVREMIQSDNKRETKKANSSIFILDRIEIPAILIECGFLSNYSEAELLSSDEYISKLAFAISRAISESCEEIN